VTGDPSDPRMEWRSFVLLWILFVALAFPLYAPALGGPLHGDDYMYLTQPALQELTAENVVEILDPGGAPARQTVNYAPVHLLAHLLENALLGGYQDVRALRAVNVVLHALNAALLVALLSAWGVGLGLGIAAGLLFLVHPANVEAVAWVMELKTLLSFAFGIGALLLYTHRPGLATVAFVLGLLSKPTAAAILPAALVLEWVGGSERAGRRRRLAWLGVWTTALLAYAIVFQDLFEHSRAYIVRDLGGLDRLRLALALPARYAVLALTGRGASVSHEPQPPGSWSDPWLLGGLATLGISLALAGLALRRRPSALPWLALAAAAYVPVSQIVQFRYPMADRYLYFVLTGLVGAAAVAATPWVSDALTRWRGGGGRRPLAPLGLALVGVLSLSVVLGAEAYQRARVWRSLTSIAMDAALNYPNGTQAALLAGIAAINRGDLAGAMAALEAARERGYVEVNNLLQDPNWAALRGHPRFAALAQDMARWWIERLGEREDLTQLELAELGRMYQIVGDLERAEVTFERALATEGSADPAALRGALREVRRMREAERPDSEVP